MDALAAYDIPVSGLKNGVHLFDYQLDSAFFGHFPNSLITEGNFEVQLVFEKRVDLYELQFSFTGEMATTCDRCLAPIRFPLAGTNCLLVKFSDEPSDDEDILYIPAKSEKLNVAPYLYEYIGLKVPFVKTYDCATEAEPPCDTEMLKHLDDNQPSDSAPAEDNPAWDALRNIKFK